MSFHRNTIRTARKEYKCNVCHGFIRKGEKYHDQANNIFDENLITQVKECEACQPVISEFMQSDYAYDGYNDEWIQEWWRDVKCPDCKKYYPLCVPNDKCKISGFIKNDVCINLKNGCCTESYTCDDMTHYCRCINFIEEKANQVDLLHPPIKCGD